jgi:hypothetical protein
MAKCPEEEDRAKIKSLSERRRPMMTKILWLVTIPTMVGAVRYVTSNTCPMP